MKTKEVEALARRKALDKGGSTRNVLSWYGVYCMAYNVVPFLGVVRNMSSKQVNMLARQCKLI